MKAIYGWIALLVAVILLSAATRYAARHAYVTENVDDSLIASLEQVLQTAGYTSLATITVSETNSTIVGYQFQSEDCASPVKIIQSSITRLHHGDAQAYFDNDENYEFLYQGLSHNGKARAYLTANWFINKIGYTLGLSPYSRSKLQLIISNPSNCNIANIRLNDVWRKTTLPTENL